MIKIEDSVEVVCSSTLLYSMCLTFVYYTVIGSHSYKNTFFRSALDGNLVLLAVVERFHHRANSSPFRMDNFGYCYIQMFNQSSKYH